MSARLGKVRALLERYRSTVITGFRFVYGFRMVAPFAIGAAGVSPVRFVTLDTISGLAWAFLFGLAGYFFGATIEVILRGFPARLAAGAATLALIALTVVIAVKRKRSKDRSGAIALSPAESGKTY